MSQLPTTPDNYTVPVRKTRQLVDDAVAQNRAVTPPAAVNQRAVPRLSIDELNAMDTDTLRDRLKAHPVHDDRPAVVKVFDWLDLPRNALWNILAPSIAERNKAKGDIGAAGLGTVHFSDVLDELGVHNHVARGILGFAGDLATDPLMYVGGIGGVARVAGTGGKVVDIIRPGVKAIREADKALAAGKWVDETAHGGKEVADILRAAGHTPETVAGMAAKATNAATATDALAEGAGGLASRTILGGIRGGPILSKITGEKAASAVADRLSRVGHAFLSEGGALAEHGAAGGVTEMQKAADAFLRKFGLANAPGWKIGEGGTQIFHIPLTSYTIQIPALGATAKNAVAVARTAADGASGLGLANKGLSPTIAPIAQGLHRMEALDKFNTQRTAAEDARTAALTAARDANPDIAAQFDIELANHTRGVAAQRAQRNAIRDQALAGIQAQIEAGVKAARPGNAADLAAMRPLIDQGQAWAKKFAAEEKGIRDTLRERAKLDLAVHKAGTDPYKDVGRLIDQQASEAGGGRSTRGPMRDATGELPEVTDVGYISPDELRPIGRAEQARRLEELDNEIKLSKKIDPEHPRLRDLEYERSLLKARDTFDDRAGFTGGTNKMPSMFDFAPTDMKTGEVVIPKDADLYHNSMMEARPVLDQLEAVDKQISELGRIHAPPVEQGGLLAATMDNRVGAEAMAAAEAHANQLRGLTEQRQALRAKLSEVTKPMRDVGDFHTLKEAQDAARQRFIDNLPADAKELLNMSKDDVARKGVDADWLHARMEANKALADATGGSIVNYMNTADRNMVNVAARVLGTDATITGASVLMPLRSALEYTGLKDTSAYIYAQKAENFLAQVFGNKSGETGRVWRWANNTNRNESRQAAQEAVNQLLGQLKGALTDAGMDKAQHLDDVLGIMLPLAMDEASKLPGADKFEVWTQKFRASQYANPEERLSEELQALDRAKKSGVFSKDVTGKLEERLRSIARGDTGLNLYKMLGDMESWDELLNNKIGGYIPMRMTDEAKAAMRTAREFGYAEGASTAKRAAGKAAESFQKERRASLEYRFNSARPDLAEGERERRFFHSDLGWVGALSDAERAALLADPDAKDAADIVRDVAEYLQMPNKPTPKYVGPMEMNKQYQQGRFNAMTFGKPLNGGFVDSNLVSLTASRVASHERAVAAEVIRRFMQDPRMNVSIKPSDYKVILDPKEAKNIENKVVTLKDGSEARVRLIRSLNGDRVPAVERGGQLYRALSSDATGAKNNPLIEALGINGKGEQLLYHDNLASKIEGAGKVWGTDDAQHIFLKGMDKALGEWKRLALFHPAFLINNLITDNINALIGGARMADYVKHTPNVIKMILNQHDPEALEKIVFDVGGQKITGRQLWADVVRQRVAEMTLASDLPNQLVQTGAMTMPSSIIGERGPLSAVKNPKQAVQLLGSDYAKMKDVYSMAAGMDKARWPQKIRAGDHVFDDRMFQWFFAPWQRLNQQTSNAGRTLAYLSHLEQGHDAESAVRKTIESMFDYTDMTKVERDVFRRIFPWYSWIKNNGIYQSKLLLNRPIFAGSVPLLQNAVEEAIDGEQRLPMNQRPNWMRENLAFQMGADPDHRAFLMTRSLLPQEQALTMLEPILGPKGVQDFLHYFVNQTNPLITKPAEYATGHEFFSGRSIDPDPLLSEVTSGGLAGSIFPPLSQVQGVSKAVKRGGVGAGVSRFILGGRIQAGDEDRLHRSRLNDFKGEEEKLRRTITRAESNGDKDTSLAGRTRLMQLYQSMIQAGFEKDVPRWAIAQLSQLSSGA